MKKFEKHEPLFYQINWWIEHFHNKPQCKPLRLGKNLDWIRINFCSGLFVQTEYFLQLIKYIKHAIAGKQQWYHRTRSEFFTRCLAFESTSFFPNFFGHGCSLSMVSFSNLLIIWQWSLSLVISTSLQLFLEAYPLFRAGPRAAPK